MPIISISGLRGVVGVDLTVNEFVDRAKAFALIINGGRCVVGRDTRSTSNLASKAVVASLLAQGCKVYDLGVVSTPAVFREVAQGGFDGGLCLTASHNPPEWGGLKFVMKGGRGIFEEELDRLSGIRSSEAAGDRSASGEYVTQAGTYVKDVVSYVGEGVCHGIKVALDLGGGVGCLFAPHIFGKLACRTMSIHSTPGVFQRIIDPVSDDLSTLSRFVAADGCDIGFAYDCDADRVVVVDDEGRKLSPDDTLLICVKHLIESMSVRDVVVSIDTSIAIDEVVGKAGGRVYRTKVGEVNVVRGLLKAGSHIGGEGSSGGLIISDFALCRDGVLASAIITKIVKEEGGIKEALEGLPKYHQIRGKIPYAREKMGDVIQRLSEEKGEIDRIDGLKITFSDASWVLMRPSRTEDVLRVSVEAKDRIRAEALMMEYLAKVRSLSEKKL